MARIGLYLDTRSTNKQNLSPLKVTIRNKGEVAYISLGINIPKNCWKNGKVVYGKGSETLSQPPRAINLRISNLFLKFENAFNEIAGIKTNMPARKLRDKVLDAVRGDEGTDSAITLRQLFEKLADDERLSESSRQLYHGTYKKIETLVPKAASLRPEDINATLVEKFYKAMTHEGLKGSTIGTYLQKFNAVYNYAVKKNLCTRQEDSPFSNRNFTKSQVPAHRNIPIEEFRQLWNMKMEKSPGSRASSLFKKRLAMDVFKLMFCLCGINAADLYRLTDKDIVNGRIETYRQKTNTRISVKLEPEALVLIKKLRRGNRLIGKVGNHTNYRAFHAWHNNWLEHIRPGLTGYYARHTWATLAFDLDIPDHVIAMGLSHAYQSGNMNAVYINNDYRKLDKANRRILDYVLGKAEP